MTKIVGKTEKCERVVTGLYSLDRACINDSGEIGVPIGTGYEVFGLEGTGKSTFCYSFGGILGRLLKSDVALSDFEGYDESFLLRIMANQGLPKTKNIHSAYDPKDEEQLDNFVVLLRDKADVGILDSIGAISPEAEVDGDIGERNMGGRGFIMAQFFRKLLRVIRSSDKKTIIATNHWYPKLGGWGYDTPGGKVKNYLLTVRFKVERVRVDGDKAFPDGSYIFKGTVVKNRWGYQDREFRVFVLAGYGVHSGLTALWDCLNLKLIKMTMTKKSKFPVSINGEKALTLGKYVKLAKQGNTEIFEPFYKLLEEYDARTRDTDYQDTDNAEPEGEESNEMDDQTAEGTE